MWAAWAQANKTSAVGLKLKMNYKSSWKLCFSVVKQVTKAEIWEVGKKTLIALPGNTLHDLPRHKLKRENQTRGTAQIWHRGDKGGRGESNCKRKFKGIDSVMDVSKRINGDTFSELCRSLHCGILTLCWLSIIGTSFLSTLFPL